MTVKATREGLIGKETATGYIIDTVVPFVALPSELAKGRLVRLANPLNGSGCFAFVLDVGPWFTDDDAYVIDGARPRAERDPQTNGSGIDLGEKVWYLLGMTDNTDVMWGFVQ